MVRHNPHHFVNIWEGRPFVHAWLGRVQRDRCVNSNKQSDHSPGGGAISPHVWMIPCILHLWALFLYVATTLSLVVVDGTSPTSLLWEFPSALFSFCLPMLYFYFVSVQATSELSPSPAKRTNNSLFVHTRNCICPLCTWKFKYTESSVTNWRGNVECTTYVFTPRPETPYQKDSLMVVMDWTLQTLEVIPMLLILAGDVETNPGPLELTVSNLSERLANVNDPIQLGTCLKIKMAVMDRIRRQYQDIDAQKREVFWFIENNQKRLGITWGKIADVVETHLYMGDLADEIRSLTMENDAPLTEPFAGAATLPQEEMPTQRPQLGLQGDTVTMETGIEEGATDEMRMDHTDDGSRLSSTSEPSDLESSSVQSSSGNSLFANSQSSYLRFEYAPFTTGATILPEEEKPTLGKRPRLEEQCGLRDSVNPVSKRPHFDDQHSTTHPALESSVTNWRGNVECTTYVFTPRPETPYQKDSMMVVMDWTLQTLEVIPMLLILAGDVETNPGPLELTVSNLSEQLANVNDPIQLGSCLKIKMAVMDKIRRQLFQTRVLCHHTRSTSAQFCYAVRTDNSEDGSRSSSTSEPSDLQSSCVQSSSRSSLSANLQSSFYFCRECGCGKCSAYDLESDKPCPNPNRLPFPKCNVTFELRGDDDNDVRPCTLQDIDHDGQQCMAMCVSCPQDITDVVRYAYILQASLKLKNIVQTKCIHYDSSISARPIVVFESKRSFVDYCSSSTLTEIDQLSFLFDIAESIINLQGSCPQRIVVTEDSIFVQEEAGGRRKALFCPLYGHSCFPQPEPVSDFNPFGDLKWISDTVAFMHHRSKTDKNIPESHILYNILHYKWLAEDEGRRPQSLVEVAKELEYILDLEKTRIGMIDVLSSSDLLDVAHLHMFLIGHTGVGKTSIRKHLQNIPIDFNEKSTVIMEPELLCQETIEASTDSTSFVFKRNENVYKSEPDKIFLTLWDTGGQPMFQDLLPCFAKVRSIYGVVFRLTDLLDSSKAVIRPTCSLECEQESPYTHREYIRRCLAFLNSFSIAMHQSFSNLPDEVKNVFETVKQSFPKVVLIGTYRDKVREFNIEEKEVLREESQQLGDSLQAYHLLDRTIRPDVDGSVLFEIDNTRSGATYEDPGMSELRKQIVSCTQSAKAKIPSEWISFKIDLERESRLQQPFTGVITFEKAKEIARKFKTNAKVALSYFHELGIFLWYYHHQDLNEYVIVEPKQLLNTLGTILNPAQFKDLPDKWKHLCDSGVVDNNLGDRLLKSNTSGLPLPWVLAFLDEHHLAIPIPAVGYYIPSMLQVRPICSNNLHVHDITTSSCSNILLNCETCPIFIVPKLECIPSGLLPRLLTALVGIENSSIKWSVPQEVKSCRNVVTLVVNKTIHVVFTEFINCIRLHYSHYVDTSSLIDVSREIVSNLKIQLQRVLPHSDGKSRLSITFACTCQKNSKPHFLELLKLPYASDDEIVCSVGTKMELTRAHKMWLQDEPTHLTSIRVRSNSDAKLLFQEAIKKGSISLNVSNVLFTGMSGADVTRCKNVILGDATASDQIPLSVNTGLEHSFFIVKSEKGVKELKLLQHEDMDNLFADYIGSGSIEDTKAKTEEAIAKSKRGDTNATMEDAITASGQTRVTDNIVPDDTKSLSASEGSIPDGTDSHDIPSEEGKSLSPLSNVKTTIPEDDCKRVTSASSTEIESSANTNELLSLITRSSVKPHHNFEIVHVVDCTNSPFLAVLPIFIPNLSLCVACADLTHDLEKCVSSKVPFDNTKQMISYCSHSASKMLIIGTHSDQTTISQQNKALRSCSDRLVSNGADAFFAIDVLSTNNELLLHIREKTTTLSTGGQSNPVPFFWHLLGNKVKELMKTVKRNVISKAECLELTEKLHLSAVDLSAALSHMHELGLLYYFEKTLPDVIFGNITIFSTIITAISAQTDSAQTDSAIVTERDFQEINNVYIDELFSSKHAIQLFLDLFIITAFKKNSFIMPCLLNEVLHEKELSKYFVQDSSVAPLVINYPKRHGIFSCLVSFLASPYNNSPWAWNINTKDGSSQPACLFRNCVQFVVPGYNTIITLFDSEISLVVYVQFPQNLCSTIKEGILVGLRKSHEHLHYDVQTLQCAENETWENDNKETIEGASGDLTVHNAFRVLLPFSEKWYNIGLYLGLGNDMMNTISVNYRHRPDLALHHSINLWFHNSRNPMWADLINPIPTLDVGILKHQALQPLVNMSIQHGRSELFKYLTKVQRYEFKGDHLLLACKHDNEVLVHYLLTELNCSPNVVGSDKLTPLVIAKNKSMIKLLLQHGAVSKDAYDQHRKILGKVFSKKSLKSPVKMFIIGHGGEGKSTLVEALQHEPSPITPLAAFFVSPKEVSGATQKTAGIEPFIFKSSIFGDILCYDLAGQDAYYSCHAVIMKTTVDTCPPIFTLVIGLHNNDKSITHSVCYWLGMIENQCKAIEGKAPLIIVGSHLDRLHDKDEVTRRKQIIIQAVAKFSKFELIDLVTMDCRYSNSEGMKLLRRSIGTCCVSIRSRLAVSLNAHMFFIFLVDNYRDVIAVTLEEVRSKLKIDAREDQSKQGREVLPFIPTTLPHLVEICEQLNDKGHILFLQNTTSPEKSFLVTNKTALMQEINGSIFAPKSFKEHCQLASSTSYRFVLESKIALAFPKHDVNMLVGFFTHFELGILIEDKEDLALIAQRLAETGEQAVPTDKRFMFYPSLISLEAPERVWEYQKEINYYVGWILFCPWSNQFLDVRFFHVLHLRLALSLNLAISIDESIPSLQHFCSVWKRGICWCNDDGVTTLVELDRHYKSITVQMRSRTLTPEFMQLRSRVINKIRGAAKELCSSVSTAECLIDPTEVVNYPMKPYSELTLFHVDHVAESVVNCKADVKSQFKTLSMDGLLQVEVYAGLGEQILQPLFNENSPEYDKAMSDHYLSALTSRLEEDPLQAKIVHYAVSKGNAGCVGDLTDILKSCTYRSLRRCLDAFSVFAGRNLLELAGVSPKPFSEDSFPILETTIDQAKVMYSPDLSTHLKSLRTVLWEIRAQWYDLAIELEVTEGTRETIKEDHRDVSKRFTALLEEWLKDKPKLDDLIKALKSPSIGRADIATELETKIKSGELVL